MENQVKITPDIISMLNLSDTSQAGFAKAIKDLKDKADRTDTAEKALNDLKEATVNKEVEAILEKGLSDKKLTVETQKQLKEAYKGKPKELQSLIDAMPAFQSISQALSKGDASKVKDLADKSWDELEKANKLQALKNADMDLFKEKFQEKFGTTYKQ